MFSAVTGFGKQIGVGKEADIFVATNEAEEALCVKLHRLGRTSFRRVKEQRDYMQHRKSASWFYLSRLSALKEFAFMKVLYDHGFPVPEPIDANRHCVIMRLLDAVQLNQVGALRNGPCSHFHHANAIGAVLIGSVCHGD